MSSVASVASVVSVKEAKSPRQSRGDSNGSESLQLPAYRLSFIDSPTRHYWLLRRQFPLLYQVACLKSDLPEVYCTCTELISGSLVDLVFSTWGSCNLFLLLLKNPSPPKTPPTFAFPLCTTFSITPRPALAAIFLAWPLVLFHHPWPQDRRYSGLSASENDFRETGNRRVRSHFVTPT